MSDKDEAKRLADALESITYFNGKSETRDAAVQMLRRWPDAGEPVAHQYLFDGYYGPVWRNDSGPWNGMQPKAIRPLYTAPPAERIAALEAVIEQARVALRGARASLHGHAYNAGIIAEVNEVLRKIEEVRRG